MKKYTVEARLRLDIEIDEDYILALQNDLVGYSSRKTTADDVPINAVIGVILSDTVISADLTGNGTDTDKCKVSVINPLVHNDVMDWQEDEE